MLIKAGTFGNGSGLETFTGRMEAPKEPEAPSLADLLLNEVGELKAAIEAAEKALPHKLAAARKEGRDEGFAERSKAEQERLQAFATTLMNAETMLSETLTSIGYFAPLIARAVLEQIFCDPNLRSGLIASSLEHHLSKLSSSAALQVRVSPGDFNSEAMAHLLQSDHLPAIVNDSGLKSGECIIDLKLGHIDLGLDTQWNKVAALLAEPDAKR
jgi:type III secretion protein L